MKTMSPFALLSPTRVKTENRRCERGGCSERTRDGKPFCPDHVDEHPYVKIVLAQLAERETQDELVAAKGQGAADLDGVTCQEILLNLRLHGGRTMERLVREINLDPKVLDGYVQALSRAGVVKLGKTERGSTIVGLVCGAAPLIPDDVVGRRASA